MINLKVVLAIILIHWVADFVFQTDKMAKGKSKNWRDLLSHTGTYSFVWLFIGGCIYLQQFRPYNPEHNKIMNIYWSYWIPRGILFVLITFIAHTITDYFTSRLNSKLAPKEETIMLKWDINQKEEPFIRFPNGRSYHNLFVNIGFDQVLHYTQLLLTYYLLTK